MIETDPEVRTGVYPYVASREFIANFINGAGDIVSLDGLKLFSPAALNDALIPSDKAVEAGSLLLRSAGQFC